MFAINQPFAFTDSGQFSECGLVINFDLHVKGTESIRTGTGRLASAFFARDRIDSVEKWTNPANGKFLTIVGNYQEQDVKATPVGGTVFEFVHHLTGQPFVVKDMAGRVVQRDRGNLTFTFLFDTTGDQFPGGILIEELSVRVSGPHPAFDATEQAFCAAVSGLIG
jgi:hypothetical protein